MNLGGHTLRTTMKYYIEQDRNTEVDQVNAAFPNCRGPRNTLNREEKREVHDEAWEAVGEEEEEEREWEGEAQREDEEEEEEQEDEEEEEEQWGGQEDEEEEFEEEEDKWAPCSHPLKKAPCSTQKRSRQQQLEEEEEEHYDHRWAPQPPHKVTRVKHSDWGLDYESPLGIKVSLDSKKVRWSVAEVTLKVPY